MAYNRKNYLMRVIEVQNITLNLKNDDEYLTYKEIFYNHIQPKYLISYKTFYNYLGINAKKELKDLQ